MLSFLDYKLHRLSFIYSRYRFSNKFSSTIKTINQTEKIIQNKSEIKKSIFSILASGLSVDIATGRLLQLLKNANQNISFHHLSMIMSQSAKFYKSRPIIQALPEINCILSRTQEERIKMISISSFIFSLNHLSSDNHEAVLELINLLVVKIDHCDEDFDSQSIGNMIYGLRNFRSQDFVVLKLLTKIADKIASCNDQMLSQHIGNALYGLQNMNSNVPQVQNLLRVLSQKISNSTHTLRPQEVGNALYGLQSMSSDDDVVLELLDVLYPKIVACKESLSPQEISNALYGLMHMSSDHLVIKKLLVFLSNKINNCQVTFRPQNISNSLFGLRFMSSDVIEVSNLLKAISNKFLNCNLEFRTQEISNSFYGLQKMNNSNEFVEDILILLNKQLMLQGVNNQWHPNNISSSFYGLQSMEIISSNLLTAFELLSLKLEYSNAFTFNGQNISNIVLGMRNIATNVSICQKIFTLLSKIILTKEINMRPLDISNSLHGFKDMHFNSSQLIIVAALSKRLKECNDSFTPIEISHIFYGIRNMGERKEVLTVIESLSSLVERSTIDFPIHQLSQLFYSFAKFNGLFPEIETLASVLSIKLLQSIEPFDPQTVGNVLYGLQGFNSESPVILRLLNIFSDKLPIFDINLNSISIGNALYGLQNMNSNVPQVQNLLRVLSQKISNSTHTLRPQEVGNALYGLQSMSSDDDVVLELLDVLYPKIVACKESLSPQEISNALYGLMNIQLDEKWKDFLSNLLNLNVCSDTENSSFYRIILLISSDESKLLVKSLKKMHLFDKLKCLESQILMLPRPGFQVESESNEKIYFQLALQYFEERKLNVQVMSNHNCYWFESDIIIQNSTNDSRIVNIEIDGVSHSTSFRKMRFTKYRDNYLTTQHNIKIRRLNVWTRSLEDSKNEFLKMLEELVDD